MVICLKPRLDSSSELHQAYPECDQDRWKLTELPINSPNFPGIWFDYLLNTQALFLEDSSLTTPKLIIFLIIFQFNQSGVQLSTRLCATILSDIFTRRLTVLIVGGKLITWERPNRILEDFGILVRNGKISEMDLSANLTAKYPEEERIDAHGQYVMPGNICAHTHFYGAFAKSSINYGGLWIGHYP
jgi:hypothetical protein